MNSVLYDAPGPRARRITWIASVIVGVLAVMAAYLLVYLPLQRNGQFTMQKWGPLLDPSDESFPLLWNRIREGFTATLVAATCAIITSLVAGTALAVLRVQLRSLAGRRFSGFAAPLGRTLRALASMLAVVTRVVIEVFRGIPVVITVVFVWIALPQLGLRFDEVLWYLVIGLTIYNCVVIGEILRSGMDGLPVGQREAAESLGLSPMQTTRMILLPQSYRIMLPALISQLVVVLKDTSLGFIIGYQEILFISTQAVQILDNPIQIYTVVGIIFVAVNYGLSKLAEYVQRRLARGRRTAGLKPIETSLEALAAQAEAGGAGRGR